MDLPRALEIFDRLSDLEADRCSRELADVRVGDPDMAELLERMLACADRSVCPVDNGIDRAFLATRFVHAEEAARSTGHAGQRLGAFALVRVLGRGGMGEVWLAAREDADFQQQVAVKLLHHGLERADAARRFVQERRILAGLTHPDIARLIDGGVSAEGQSWYAMEYVDGQTITQFANQRDLDVRARVELVARATEAVAAAQAQDVVHRDLKPSNILVDASGRPHLLDFGIAKWLSPGSDGGETATGMRALSPAYAAPEQIFGESITRATDVYALGMVLYELLVGQLPSQRAQHSLERLAEQVRAEQILAPSAHRRRLQGSTQRRLDADLDDIVMTSLHREPAQRYPDAAALAADLHRWLASKPINARGTARRIHWSRWRRPLASPWLAALAGAVLVASMVIAWNAAGPGVIREDDSRIPVANPEAATARHQAIREKMARGGLVALQGAVAELDALMRDHPDFMPAYASAANALTTLGWHAQIDRGEALRRLRLLSGRALARKPDSLEARILAARLRYVESEFQPSQPRYLAALREHELLLREAPADRGLLLTLANLSGILGRLEDALQFARRANAIDANDDQAYEIETRALVGLGRWEEALLAQREALARSPRRGDTFEFIVAGHTARGQFSDALAAVEQCRQAGADRCERQHTHILRMLRAEPAPAIRGDAEPDFWEALRTGGFDAGQRWIDAQEAKGRQVFAIFAYSLLGVALTENRSDAALAIIARRSPGLIDGDPALPHETDWLLAAGVAYVQKKDSERANEAFGRALVAADILPERARAQQAQLPDVVALSWLGREDEALRRMRRYVDLGWSNERAMTEDVVGNTDPLIARLATNADFPQLIDTVRDRNERARALVLAPALQPR